MHFIRLTVLVVCLAARLAAAQETVSLAGQVKDAETGLPLPYVDAILKGTNFRAMTDQTGHFCFYSLAPGRYDLQVSLLGYASAEVSGIVISSDAPWTVEIRLRPQPLIMPEITVEAQALPAAGLFSGARIISQQQLREQKPRDLAELLQKEGLADVSSDGSPGGAKTVSLRGSASDQVLVLLDGHLLNEASNGVADLARISLAEVEQVEIYPQAASNLGAQSIGGIINIVTLKPGLESTRLQAAISGYGERQGSVTLGRTWGKWPILGIFEHHESDGEYRYRVVPDDGLDVYTRNVGQTLIRRDAAYRRDYISLKVDPPGIAQIGFRQTLLQRQNPDYLPLPVLEHKSSTNDSRQEFTLDLRPGAIWYRPATHFKVEGYQQTTTTDYGPEYPLLYRHSGLRGEAYSAQSDWNRRWDWREVAFGAGLRWERLWSSDLEGGYAERLHKYGYLQVQGDPLAASDLPVRMGLYSGVRADLYSGQSAFVHPSLGMEFNGGKRLSWSLRGELAGAYHLPSFNALFWQEDLQSRGNPQLKPERSLNREIAGKLGWGRWEIGATYFDRQVQDLIYWRLDFDNKWKPLNLYQAQISGAESSLRGSSGEGFGAVEVTLMHRWMRTTNQSGEANTDGKLLPYRPLHVFILSLKQNLRIVSWDLAARWVSRRYTNEANTKSLSPYSVWSWGVTKAIRFESGRAAVTLRAEIRNLFNQSYRLVEGAPLPMREWWLTVGFEQMGHSGN